MANIFQSKPRTHNLVVRGKKTLKRIISSIFWFSVGFILSGTVLASIILFYFQQTYKNKVIPGVFIDNTYIGEKNRDQIEKIYSEKNIRVVKSTIIFSADGFSATASAATLGIGYDTNLITEQALSLGKTKSVLTDTYLILASYVNGTFLKASFTYDSQALTKNISEIKKAIYKEPVDAQFKVEGNKVVAFLESHDGQDVDSESLNQRLKDLIPQLVREENPKIVAVDIPIKILHPNTTTEEANNFGIVEPFGVGKSTFYHSIPGRIYNVGLATSKINGVLVAPNEEFSFDKALGDVSKFIGYKEAYIISGGKTILGDGGGVCQVSTTLFRALLNAGLPITERHAHAYRVGYYEQDQPPGFDATTFVPTVDLKFKNDTQNYILIQGVVDTTNLSMSFTLYGKSDGRKTEISRPVISDVSPAPPDVYQDDPTLPVGTIKQVDFAAPGGKSVFTRKVTRNGQEIISDTFVSVYRPWQAVFLRGTKT